MRERKKTENDMDRGRQEVSWTGRKKVKRKTRWRREKTWRPPPSVCPTGDFSSTQVKPRKVCLLETATTSEISPRQLFPKRRGGGTTGPRILIPSGQKTK